MLCFFLNATNIFSRINFVLAGNYYTLEYIHCSDHKKKNLLKKLHLHRIFNIFCQLIKVFFSFLDGSSKVTDAPIFDFISLCGVKVVVEVMDSESNFSLFAILVTLADRFK